MSISVEPVSVKQCTCFDWKELTEVMKEVFPDMSYDEISYYCRQHHKQSLQLLYTDSCCVGFFLASPRAELNVLWLRLIGIRKQFQGRGFGRILIKEFEAQAARMGYPPVQLVVEKHNQAAIEFYERNNYNRLSKVGAKWTYQKSISTDKSRQEIPSKPWGILGPIVKMYWRIVYWVLVESRLK